MPTAQQITDSIDARFEELRPSLVVKQDGYQTVHGRYFQGLMTHSTLPEDGLSTPPDRLDTRPYYQDEDWLAVGFDVDSPRVAVSIDQYAGPQGQGYVVLLTLKIAGDIWQRSIAFGPETSRDRAWEVMEPV